MVHGHTHRLGKVYRTSFGGGVLVGLEAGTLADPATTPSNGSVLNWQHGFVDVWVSKTGPRFSATCVPITDGGFLHAGRHYGT